MNLPDKFEYGRFKLESCFWNDFQYDENGGSCTIIINGYTMLAQLKEEYIPNTRFNAVKIGIAKACAESSLKTGLLSGETITVIFKDKVYDLNIEKEKWVCMSKKYL